MFARTCASTFRLASNRSYATMASSASQLRHLMSINDLTPAEFTKLVRNAAAHKKAVKSQGAKSCALSDALKGQTVAMLFSKRSTRTRVSTESAVALVGGHPLFLGKDDIQLGVNESLRDTSIIISSMVSSIVARVGPHSDIEGLAQYSTAPIINALSDKFHPMQIVADFLTIHETFPASSSISPDSLGLEGLKVAWVGDSNNVLFDLASACIKMGVDISVASPDGYNIPLDMKEHILTASSGVSKAGKLTETTKPEEAVKDANIIVTDTWISMGQEEESKKRLTAFNGFQVTEELAKRGGAKPDWKFMHCLPRHPEEVSDEVFYGDRSLVFPEGENRLWAAVCEYTYPGFYDRISTNAIAATLEGFVVNKGKIV